jgi:hypothetical protein
MITVPVPGRAGFLPRIGYREGGYWVHAAPPRDPRVAGRLMSPLALEEIAGLGSEEVVRSAAVAIGVIAASGRVIYSNARMRELTNGLGYDMPTQLDGGIDIFHPDGRRYEQREWPAVRSITSGEEIAHQDLRPGRRGPERVDDGARRS